MALIGNEAPLNRRHAHKTQLCRGQNTCVLVLVRSLWPQTEPLLCCNRSGFHPVTRTCFSVGSESLSVVACSLTESLNPEYVLSQNEGADVPTVLGVPAIGTYIVRTSSCPARKCYASNLDVMVKKVGSGVSQPLVTIRVTLVISNLIRLFPHL